MEARENSAATLFSLSIVDENKVTIGASGAIPALVQLLSNGSQRGKKDAATALFNLCIYQGNKGKAVRAGLVPILLELLTETESGMVDEALAILAILSGHPEGKAAIGAASEMDLQGAKKMQLL
jgi:vesicle coat complex subunit